VETLLVAKQIQALQIDTVSECDKDTKQNTDSLSVLSDLSPKTEQESSCQLKAVNKDQQSEYTYEKTTVDETASVVSKQDNISLSALAMDPQFNLSLAGRSRFDSATIDLASYLKIETAGQ